MKKRKLYRPVIVRKEVQDNHYYYVDGQFFPGVTTILHETLPTPFALKQWLGEVGNEKAEVKLKLAADRGTKIHNACENLLKGDRIKLHEEFPDRRDQKCIVAFIDWVNEVQPEYDPKYIEFVVASQAGFAGTVDFFCKINGEPWIIDFKTSRGVYESHKLQATAYQQAFYEMTGIMANRAILHLNFRTKKGWSFVTKMEMKGKDISFEDFMKVFALYKVLNGGEIPEPKMTEAYPRLVKLYDEEESNGQT